VEDLLLLIFGDFIVVVVGNFRQMSFKKWNRVGCLITSYLNNFDN
jgi:hypothetical protein